MNYDDFFKEAAHRKTRITLENLSDLPFSTLSNEALFQLPLLAMVILTIAKGKTKPALSEIGQLAGECLERTVAGFKGSSQDIGWSANLRIRTVKALTFLEAAELAAVSGLTKEIIVTEKGRRVFDRAMEVEGHLSNALLTIERSYQNIVAEQKIREEIS